MAAMPVHDYLIGGDPAEQKQFVLSRSRVEQAFEKARAVPFGLEQERTAVQSAWEEWQQAQRLGEELLQFRSPAGNPAAAATMKRFDAHFHRAVALFDQVYDLARREIDEDLLTARTARTQTIWITFGAFALALMVSLVVGLLLSRYVILAVEELRQGAKRLAGGELAHRVALARNDELGELAAAFDVMAERLEENRKALQELAIRDGLTGLINHREFWRRLEEEAERARRYRRPLALLMLDIDHFKTSTTLTVTPPGTRYCARSPRASSRGCARPTPWHGWAETSSPWCLPGWAASTRPPLPRRSRRRSSPRW